jgi:hypothetical protein
VYKVAARWSDGITSELKTYALCCKECLATFFRQARQKQAACRTTRGETLETPGIFLVQHGQRDKQLQRLSDLEAQILAGEAEASKPPA